MPHLTQSKGESPSSVQQGLPWSGSLGITPSSSLTLPHPLPVPTQSLGTCSSLCVKHSLPNIHMAVSLISLQLPPSRGAVPDPSTWSHSTPPHPGSKGLALSVARRTGPGFGSPSRNSYCTGEEMMLLNAHSLLLRLEGTDLHPSHDTDIV